MKNQFKFFALGTLVFICNLTFGQNNMEDVVYLKSGNIYRGIIIEKIPNQSVKIQTKDRNVFVVKFDEIEKLTKENQPIANFTKTVLGKEYKKSGFVNITEIDFCPGIGYINDPFGQERKNNYFSYGIKTVNGYKFNESITLGVGIGIDIYKLRILSSLSSYQYSTLLLPLTIDARYYFLKGKFSPSFNLNIGYSTKLTGLKGGVTGSNDGAFLINPSIGIKTFLAPNIAYIFHVGYKLQFFDIDYQPYANIGTQSISTMSTMSGFFTITTGLSF